MCAWAAAVSRAEIMLTTDISHISQLLAANAAERPAAPAYTFLPDARSEIRLTYAELERRARTLGAVLARESAAGERVLLLCPPGIDYLVSLYACWTAGLVAVPAYAPRNQRQTARIAAIADDCRPTVALGSGALLARAQTLLAAAGYSAPLRWIAADRSGSLEEPLPPVDHRAPPGELALLQYTSGSTGDPKGVMVTHRNVIANLVATNARFEMSREDIGCIWLPPYHDMGLIGGILQPMFAGCHVVLMPPTSFLQNPAHWLQTISRYRATVAGGPNFGYELCVDRITDQQTRDLDLSCWRLAFNGAEPIRAETLQRFCSRFSNAGFRSSSLYSCYGLAEATLMISGGRPGEGPVHLPLQRDSLERFRVDVAPDGDPGRRVMVGCGRPLEGHRLLIVNPDTARICARNEIGEIWIDGPSVAAGYWEKPESTREVFRAQPIDFDSQQSFLRSGDLGFLHDGELYVTGRIKDIIIIAGRNLYSQDIEQAVAGCPASVRALGGAAISLPSDSGERLVLLQELERGQHSDHAGIVGEIRRVIVETFDIAPHMIVLLPPNSIPRTTSGKIRRAAAAEMFQRGEFAVIFQWQSQPENDGRGPLELPAPSYEAIRGFLIRYVAQASGAAVDAIDTSQPIAYYGLGSVQAVKLAAEFQTWLGRPIAPTLAWDFPTIEKLSRHLSGLSEAESVASSHQARRMDEPIAIVGMAGRFADARDLDEFWRLLHEGRDAIRDMPQRPSTNSSAIPRRGGFLHDVDRFDAHFFGISPREAAHMDPQQRLLLEVAWEAIENSGQAADRLAGGNCGVFVGISTSDYASVTRDAGAEALDIYTGTGNAHSIAANRLSYSLNLHGPSIAVDTACSSSLVAVHLACQSLRAGESDLALAGGVNVVLDDQWNSVFSKARMLAPDGRCKTFDAAADGYGRGEGCGVIVLKRLSDALAGREQIFAVVRGSAVNQDGRSNGLTAPSGGAQRAVIRAALKQADVDAADVGYIETHGTGTPLGDPIEIEALKAVFGAGRAQDRLIGSVKTNIGHLEAAAGIAGLIKVALSLWHELIPQHLNLRVLNPAIKLRDAGFAVGTAGRRWPRGHRPRIAGVSSFGFGGTNAHVVLCEAPLPPAGAPPTAIERPRHVLALSAKNAASLRMLAQRYAECCERNPQPLSDLCYSANVGRVHFSQRLAITATSLPELAKRLRSFEAGSREHRTAPHIGLLFTGQGAQYLGMGRQLYETQPTFRATLDRCATIVQSMLPRPLLSVLFDESQQTLLDQTLYTQPALFALEYALYQLWRLWGVVPTTLAGHSIGQYVAACVAGVLTLEEGLLLAATRGRLMQERAPPGAMAAIFAPLQEVDEMLAACALPVGVGGVNGPRHVVISGQRAAVAEVVNRFREKSVNTRILSVSHAFHCREMLPVVEAFDSVLATIAFQVPNLPLLSDLSGGVFAGDSRPDRAYWRRHLTEPVRFDAVLDRLAAQRCDVLIEIGPQPVLLGLADAARLQPAALLLPSLRRTEPDNWQTLLHSLAALYERGVHLDWNGFDRDYARRKVSVPCYPFDGQRYWIGPPAVQADQENAAMTLPSTSPIAQPEAAGRKMRILATLLATVAPLLQRPPEDIDVHAPVLDLGADSLILMGAVQFVRDNYGINISLQRLFEEITTLDALATYIDASLPVEAPGNATASSVTPTAVDPLPQASDDPPPALAPSSMLNQVGTDHLFRHQLDLVRDVIARQLTALHGVPSAVPASEAPQARATAAPPLQAARPHAPGNVAKNERATAIAGSALPPWKPPESAQHRRLGDAQQRYLQEFIESYVKRTRRSKDWATSQRAHLADIRAVAGFRLTTKEMLYRIVCDRSSGSQIWDIDGNQYIDLTMGFGVNLFGHSPGFLRNVLREQLDAGIHLGPQAVLTGDVARMICELTGMERVTFTNSGTESVMTALRIVRTVSGRSRIALFSGSYHGTFDGVLARPSGALGSAESLPVAAGIPKNMVENVMILPYGSPEAFDQIEKYRDELAAILVEPVQSRRPDLQPREFLQKLRELTSAWGIALVFDEVLTGFRLNQRGAQGYYDIQADVATYGKIVGGGLPIGLVAGKARFMDAIDGGAWSYGDDSYPGVPTTFFAGTFCAHPLAMAAAHAVLNHIKQEGAPLYEQINNRTSYLSRTLNQFFDRRCPGLRIANCGSLFRLYSQGDIELLYYHLMQRGVYIWEGRNCFLSTAHTDQDVERIITAFQESVTILQRYGFLPLPPSQGPGEHQEQPAQNPVQARGDAAPAPRSDAAGVLALDDVAVIAPLTDAQKQLWALSKLSVAASAAYNEPLVLRLRGTLNVAALEQSLQQACDRHEALRTVVDRSGEHQRIFPRRQFPFPCTDLSRDRQIEQDQRLSDELRREIDTPFSLTEGPLIRFRLFKLADDHWWLIIVGHHIVMDGWSFGMLLNELVQSYAAIVHSRHLQLAPPSPFRQYAHQQVLAAHEPTMQAHEAFWLTHLQAPLPVTDLPTARPRPPVMRFIGARASMELDSACTAALKATAVAHKSTLFLLLCAGFTTLLHRVTGQDDLIIGIFGNGRETKEAENTLGYCANMMPLRAVAARDPSFRQYLQKLKSEYFSVLEHRSYPYARLLRKLHLSADPSRPSLINVTFNLEARWALPALADLSFEMIPAPISHAKFDLSLNITETHGTLLLDMDYSADLFDAAYIERLLQHYRTLLEGISRDADQPIRRLAIFTESQRRQIIQDWNATALPVPAATCLPDLFETQAAKTPHKIAVIADEETVTYSALERRANQLGSLLREKGIGRESRVAIYLERSIDMVVALLGTLKAGAAYVPIDPGYPPSRVAYMLADAAVAAVLTQPSLRDKLPRPLPNVIDVGAGADIDHRPTSALRHGIGPGNLAYLIYTSGSTGDPKGVCVSHASVVNFLLAMQQRPAISGSDVVLNLTSIAFDIFALELYLPLIVGAQVVLADESIARDANALAALMARRRVSLAQATPATWRLLLEADWKPPRRLKLLSGGDSLPLKTAVALKRGGHDVWNMYGPTETTVWSTIHQLPDRLTDISIGRPIANTRIYILSEELQAVAVGSPGELYIGGAGVARGYHRRPGLTAERFLPDPFSNIPGQRIYRSGDIARYREDGTIELLGRADSQVKIRGYRIELREIELTLLRHPHVRDALVDAQRQPDGEAKLIAYVVPHGRDDSTIGRLREHVAEFLPKYMLPNEYALLQALPLTPNGKLDRSKLAGAGAPRLAAPPPVTPPRTGTEQTLCELWQSLLGVPVTDIDASFFELGGHSLTAAKLSIEMAERLKIDVPMASIYQLATIRLLAQHVDATLAAPEPVPPSAPAQVRRTRRRISGDLRDLRFGAMVLALHAPAALMTLYYMLIRRFHRRHARNIQLAIPRFLACRLLALSGIEVECVGLDKLSESAGKPIVIFCNHNSRFDAYILFSRLPVRYKWFRSDEDHVARERLRMIEWIGNTFDLTFMHRKRDPWATESAFKAATHHVKTGESIAFFPEGQFGGGRLSRFGENCARVAIEAAAPVVPVALIGTEHLYEANGYHYRPGKVRLVVGDPIDTRGYARDQHARLARDAREVILELLTRFGPATGGSQAADAMMMTAGLQASADRRRGSAAATHGAAPRLEE
jgi:amino acid adenylation domain-containing protein